MIRMRILTRNFKMSCRSKFEPNRINIGKETWSAEKGRRQVYKIFKRKIVWMQVTFSEKNKEIKIDVSVYYLNFERGTSLI